MTRRDLLAAALAVPLVRAAGAKIPIGITDWNLRLSANPEAIPLAAQLGFDGIQISCGRRAGRAARPGCRRQNPHRDHRLEPASLRQSGSHSAGRPTGLRRYPDLLWPPPGGG